MIQHTFKVWDKKKKRMVGQQWILPNKDDRFEVLILSGVKDKDGVDIGHGDILQFYNKKYIVLYDNMELKWTIVPFVVNKKGNREYGMVNIFNAKTAENMRVIGNILQQEVDNGGETL